LRKIIREDLQMELDDFLEKYYEFSGKKPRPFAPVRGQALVQPNEPKLKKG